MSESSEGLKIRAQIDNDLVKGLLIINGGGAVALLAFLSNIMKVPEYAPLSTAVVWALLAFVFGVWFTLIHNRFRRHCSLEFERKNFNPPACKNFVLVFLSLITFGGRSRPCVCVVSEVFMKLAFVAFIVGGMTVFWGGIQVLDKLSVN